MRFVHEAFFKYAYSMAIMFWFTFIAIICFIVIHQMGAHTVTPAYLKGANLWSQGKDLYDGTGRGFIYLPQSALFFVPYAYLAKFSFVLMEVVWRIISLLVLMVAVWKFAHLFASKYFTPVFFILTAVILPLIFSSARNGQFNTIIEALMLFAVCAVSQNKWWQAVFYLAIGFALKPTMIVLFLLMLGLYPKLWWRGFLGLLIIFLLPLFFKEQHYVITQYQNSIAMLKTAAQLGVTTDVWAQFFGLLAKIKIILSPLWQNILRVIMAFCTLFCGFYVTKKFQKNYAAIFLYTIATIYLLLFNPRTESTDYGMIAPALGMFIGMFYVVHHKWQMYFTVAVSVGLLFAGHITFDGYAHEYWSAPFFVVIFAIIIVRQIFINKVYLKGG